MPGFFAKTGGNGSNPGNVVFAGGKLGSMAPATFNIAAI